MGPYEPAQDHARCHPPCMEQDANWIKICFYFERIFLLKFADMMLAPSLLIPSKKIGLHIW